MSNPNPHDEIMFSGRRINLMARRGNNGGCSSVATANVIDRDVEAMLRKSQPGYFSGEGDNVGELLEEWFERMEDYFDLAHSSEENKAMMGRFKLEKSAKLWWKNHCKENAIDPTNVSWDYLSTQLSKSYQTRTYHVDKINEFLDSVQGEDTLDIFYQRFLKLLKYAPAGMDQEAKVARFVSKLNPPLDTRLQSLRLTTFADVLDAGRPIEQEIAKLTKKDDKVTTHKEAANREAPKKKRGAEVTPRRVQDQRPRLPSLLFEKAKRENLCLTCLEPDHRARDCPYARSNPRPMTQNAEGFQRRGNGGTNQYRDNRPTNANQNPNQRRAYPGNAQGGNHQNPPRPFQNQGNQRPNANLNPRNPPQRAQVHHMQANHEDNVEIGHLNAAIEHQGPNRQYAVLQTPAEYEGKKFKLLIDSGATHSFISPAAIRKLIRFLTIMNRREV